MSWNSVEKDLVNDFICSEFTKQATVDNVDENTISILLGNLQLILNEDGTYFIKRTMSFK